MPFDVVEALRDLGFRCPAANITAMLEEATKAKLSPVQVCERLAKLERRERDARNLGVDPIRWTVSLRCCFHRMNELELERALVVDRRVAAR